MAHTHYKVVTINSSAAGSAGALASFPVVIALTDADLAYVSSGGKAANANNGYDIRPYAGNDPTFATALSYELVYYVGTSGAIEMHINCGTGASQVSSAGDSFITLGFGDAALNTDGSTTGAWNANFKGVYHFGTPTGLVVLDSTANDADATNHSVTATTGKLGGGGSFDGSSKYLDLGTSVFNFSGTAPLTLSAWINVTSFAADSRIINRFNGGVAGQYYLGLRSATDIQYAREASPFSGLGNSALSTSTWYLIHYVYNGTNLSLFLNGAAENTPVAYGSVASETLNLYIGAGQTSGAPAAYFNGIIDEVRFVDAARSASWVLAEYNNQKASQSLLTFGSLVAVSSPAALPVFMNQYRQRRT